MLAAIFLATVLAYFYMLMNDDIILIAPSVEGFQKLLTVCEEALDENDMQINVKKSKCLRFGARYNCNCADLTLQNGDRVDWVDSCRYLGVYLGLVSAPSFRCSFHEARANFTEHLMGSLGKLVYMHQRMLSLVWLHPVVKVGRH